jgi:outer membrane protein insertion porin family
MLTGEKGWLESGAYEPGVLEDDRSAVIMAYRNQGFLNPGVETELHWEKDEDKNNWGHLTYHVEEGTRTRVESIRFSGLSVMDETEALSVLALQKDGPYSEKSMHDDETTLSAAISEKGYPRVTVAGSVEFTEDKQGARVLFTVEPGPYMAMGNLIILGNFRTRDRIIEREMELTKDDPFSLVAFLESQRNIRNINALNGANFSEFGLAEKHESVDLVVETREKKPYYVQAATGYDTTRHGYVNTKVGDRNLLGLNKDGWISGEFSEIGYKVESGVTEPRFLGTRISATLNVFSEEREELNKDFGTRIHGSSLSLNRDFLTYYNAGLSFRYEYRDQYKRDEEVVPDEEIEFYEGRRRVVTSPSLIYNSTDSFIRPRKGIYSYVSVDLSKALGDAPDEFLKYNVQAHYYYSPLSFLTLAFRCRYGYIQPTGGNDLIPDDQLFFLGGTADVRGFDENMLRYDLSGDPVGGREMTMGGIEIRTDLGRQWELVTFFDTGCIRKTTSSDGSDRFRSSVGAGLRYVTPIGPIGFLYGFKLDPDESEAKGQLHFTLGYSF